MAKSYDEQKEYINEYQTAQRRKGRDIAPIPQVENPERKQACREDFKLFCETYYPAVFNLEWSADHLQVIALAEDAVLRGALSAVAMPRGSGKTSLSLALCVWAILYGHRSFPALVAASESRAYELLENIKVELEVNPHLAADFPEVCYPIACIEGRANLCTGQLCEGEQTRIGWTQTELVLPTIPGSAASGAVLRVAGITGAIRGMQAKRASDSATIRPDIVIIDDPQTDESANSPTQVDKRLKTVAGAILGLAGPGKKIAGIMPCTVIAKDDMADRVLDRKQYPEWQGVRTKLLKSLPTDVKAWEEYAEKRATGLREGRGLEDATAFYVAHRDALDAGAIASWPARFNPDEVSAVQNCMNLKLRDEASFLAEYQNEPLSLAEDAPLKFETQDVLNKIDLGHGRGVVPDWATRLVAQLDVQGQLIYYAVTAFNEDFTAHVVSYGSYPDQNVAYYRLRDINNTLTKAHRGMSSEAALTAGLKAITTDLLKRDWKRQDGKLMQITRLNVDAGYQGEVIKAFIKGSEYRSRMLPTIGWAKPDFKPMNEWIKKPGERVGWNWRLKTGEHLLADANGWKTFLAQRILSNPGDPGNLTIFRASETQHRLFAEQVAAEYIKPQKPGETRVMNEWALRPGRENHFLDCLYGCYVAASEQGVLGIGHSPSVEKRITRPRKNYNFKF